MGVELSLDDWQRIGEDVPLLVNCMPAGNTWAKVSTARAVCRRSCMNCKKPAACTDCATVSGKTIGEIVSGTLTSNADVIYPFETPLKHRAGFIVLSGNFFDSAIMKMSVVGEAFRKTYLSEPGAENSFEARAIVFEGPEDYHARIDDPSLDIDERCILVIRGAGTVGYPGSAEVVNMAPPAALIKQGIDSLPCLGDGRQSGTSASPSILNMSPEAAVGGGLALLKTNDRLRVDLNARSVNLLVDEAEMARRRASGRRTSPPRKPLAGALPPTGRATVHRRLPGTGDPAPASHRPQWRRAPAFALTGRSTALLSRRRPGWQAVVTVHALHSTTKDRAANSNHSAPKASYHPGSSSKNKRRTMAAILQKQGDSTDFSVAAVADTHRMSKPSLTMAWWGICSAMFWLVVSATLAMTFGTQNAIIGLLLSVVTYAAINGVIARYAIKTGLSVALFSRVLFGRKGAILATLIFFATATYYSVFEGSVIAIAIQQYVPTLSINQATCWWCCTACR
jgi:hypothetical protein